MTRQIALLAALTLTVAGCNDDGGGGTPVDEVTATFVVHAPSSTPADAVLYMAGDLNAWTPNSPQHAFTKTADRTYQLVLRLPRGTRVEFKITRGTWDAVERGSRGEATPNRIFDVPEDSLFDLTVGSWADIAVSTVVGDVTKTTVPGFVANRQVWIYRPPGYATSTARYPVLYMLDAQNVFDFQTSFAGEWMVDETLEELIPAGQVAPLMVVAVENSSNRIYEYTPWDDPDPQYLGGGGDAHLDAIADVLVPWVDANYRTLTGPANRAFGGSSLGGLMALYATYTRPDVFGHGMAMSPSIWWDYQHIVSYATDTGKPAGAQVWMDMGTAEYTEGISDLRAMRDAMVAQGFVLDGDLKSIEDPGAAHNEAAWSRRFPTAVKWLFPPAP